MKRIAFIVCFSLPLGLLAQEQKDSTELEPVEVRATRAAATAPFAKTNLSKKEIERQNLVQDLPFLLNQTPSVVVNSDAGNGVGYTGIRIRGTDATRINITLNGIPFNDPESGGSFFVNLPDFSSSVGSIQVQRGVGTSTNGAGAFGGTINMSTNEVNRRPYAEFNNSYGSFNTWKHTIKAGSGLINDHFTTDIRLSKISSDGFIDRASSDLKSFYFSSAYIANNTTLRINVFSGKEKTYQAWYGITEADLKNNRRVNYAGTAKPGAPYENETDNYSQDHFQLIISQKLNEHLILSNTVFLVKGKGYYEQYRADEKYSKYGLPNMIYGSDTIKRSDFIRQLWLDNDFYGDVFSLQYARNHSKIDIGGSIMKYDGKHVGKIIWASNGMNQPGFQWYRLPAEKTDMSVYGKWQQLLDKNWSLFTDLQIRRVEYVIQGFRDNPILNVVNQYNFFNPKLGITYRKNSLMSYVSYSVANKEPNRDDFEAGTSQQPKREKLNDWEAGLEYRTNKASWAANFYYMDYKDQLVLTGKINDVGAYTRTNIASSYRAGIELQGSYSFRSWLKASANLALSKNRIRNFTEYIDDYDNGGQKTNEYKEVDIAFSPGIVGAATISMQPVQNMNIDLISKYVGKQFLDNTQQDSRSLSAYYTQDLRLAYSFSKKWMKNLELVFQVYNLFDKKYEPNGYTFSYYYNNQLTTENYYFPMAGRNWMAGVNIKL